MGAANLPVVCGGLVTPRHRQRAEPTASPRPWSILPPSAAGARRCLVALMSSPRSLRRCLQVRRSIGVFWFLQAGHVHEYTPPVFFNTYGLAPEPFISVDSPSARSGMAADFTANRAQRWRKDKAFPSRYHRRTHLEF